MSKELKSTTENGNKYYREITQLDLTQAKEDINKTLKKL
jgi:hypothetical protein